MPFLALTAYFRQCQVIEGEQGACFRQVRALLAQTDELTCVWVSSHPDISKAIPAKKVHTLLGQAFDCVVFDAHSGLDVNAFAAVLGTLRGGGMLYLLTPPLSDWSHFADPDYRRFTPYLYSSEHIKGRFLQRFIALLRDYQTQPLPMQTSINTALVEQAMVVETLVSATQPVILTADRGRGKSAALGMAASQLLAQGLTVLLTAPAKATVVSVMQHAPLAPRFIAPDELLQTLPPAAVLLVDEAAAIPLPLLMQMLVHYPRCVFATTIHGYEGSGRGFALRFQQWLKQQYPHRLTLRLTQPMRWAVNDPLEAFVNRVLLLDTEPVQPQCLEGAVSYHHIQRDNLVHNEALLRQIFGLLVAAHYQTRPSDLRQLLDAPALSVHVLRQGKQVVAVALLSREGGLDATLTAAIHAGTRRPHGHLVPQTLTFHAQMAGAAELVCERVMRIAVHPACQSQGFGSQLLEHLLGFASQNTADYLSVSYAYTPALQRFWDKAGLVVARVGLRKDTASGSHSVVQIKPLSARGQQFFQGLVGKVTPCTDPR